MRCVILLCLSLILLTDGYTQSIEWQFVLEKEVRDFDLVSMDNRGNVICSDREGNVYEIDASGTVTNQYSPILQGKLAQLDVFSALTLFLFSSDLQQIVLLDRHLVPFSTFSLSRDVFGIVKAAALGNSNVFWLFDEADNSLKKYDYKRRELLQVQSLGLIIGEGRIEVVDIQERKNLVYMHIKNRGIYVFDNQGNFLNQHPVQLKQKMSVYEDCLYYVKDENVRQLNLNTGEELRYKVPQSATQEKIMVGPGTMVFYSNELIQVFNYKKTI